MIDGGSFIFWFAGECPRANKYTKALEALIILTMIDIKTKFFMDVRIPTALHRLVPVTGGELPKDRFVATPS